MIQFLAANGQIMKGWKAVKIVLPSRRKEKLENKANNQSATNYLLVLIYLITT